MDTFAVKQKKKQKKATRKKKRKTDLDLPKDYL